MSQETDEHLFGGTWTDVKLKALAEYLQFYTSALKDKPSPATPFELWYVDAFAGSGVRTAYQETGGIEAGVPVGREKVQIEGSARRAIRIDPPFKHLIFIEENARRHRALQALASQYTNRDIRPLKGDANAELQKLFSEPPWTGRGSSLQRAVVFLDPYGMNVKWTTLELLTRTKRVDVWYLFPLQAVLRQLAHDYGAVDLAKQASLDEVFGRPDWRADLYKPRALDGDLFDYVHAGQQRDADPKRVESYFKEQLENLFPFVSQPVPLLTGKGLQQFSLFCACANPDVRAINLIKRGVDHVVKKYTPASRRKSVL